MQEIALFSGKIYTAGTNFTRLLVMSVATNLISGLSLFHLQVGRKYQLFLPKFLAGSEKGKELKNFTYNSNFPSVRKNLSWQLKRPQLAWSTDTQTLLWLKSEESKAKSGPRGDAATSTPPITPFSVRTAPIIPTTGKPFYILARKIRVGEIHSAKYIYRIPNSL